MGTLVTTATAFTPTIPLTISYHIRLLREDCILHAFQCHPLDRQLYPFTFVLSEVHLVISVLRKTKVCYFDHSIVVNPKKMGLIK